MLRARVATGARRRRRSGAEAGEMPRIALQPGPEQGAERAAIRTKGAGGGPARHSTAQHVDQDPET
jgi:hypothetical protein